MDEKVFLSIPLFKDIPRAEMAAIVSSLPTATFASGAYLCMAMQDNLFVVANSRWFWLRIPG
jgi:hypothetical protein